MSRLTGNLVQSAGKRFFFALDSSPGIVAPGVAVLQIQGRQPIAVEPQTVFRTPALAVVTIQGLGFFAPSNVTPAPAALSAAGQVPNEVRQLTITPALPAAYENPPAAFAPTLITIWTVRPGLGQVTLNSLPLNATPGGNIGFITPAIGQITFSTLGYTLKFGSEIGIAALTAQGLAPTMKYELTIHPDVGLVSASQLAPILSLPFIWVDDRPVSSSAWITDRAA